MKKIIWVPVILVITFLISCSNNKPETTTGAIPKHKVNYVLNTNFIYNHDSIDVAMKRADDNQKAEGRKMFMLGLDLLVNKNQAEASIEYFKEAAYFYPEDKTYGFLFRAYLKTGNLSLADSANNAMVFSGGPLDEASFNSALIAATKKDTVNCIASLDESFFYGFINRDKIINEPLFDFVKDDKRFQALVVANFGNEETFKRKLFASYLKSLPELSFPFEISVDSVATFNYEASLDYEYASFIPGMITSQFSRDVSNSYLALGKIKLNNGHAVIYKMYNVIADTLNPVSTYAITYDTLGTMVSNEVIACFCSPMERKACNISKDLIISTTSYKIEWQKDPLESGYANNKIVSQSETIKEQFSINSKNEIIKENKEALATSDR